ncbi:metallophosphoesterase [Pelagibacterium sp.]|uniref:metallophosphoesterase n=1 Tax=Pelagibacterium sp. TaxID=1967288 RepID=UPI003A90462F
MKIWTLSDLHIDVNHADDLDLGPHPDCDVIIVAGDVCDGGYHDPAPWLLNEFSDDERAKLLFVAGNHEAYGQGLDLVPDYLTRLTDRTGITILHRSVVEIGNQRFVGCPLWSDFSPRLDEHWGDKGDFAAVPDLTPDTWRAEHRRDRAWLEEVLEPGDVVVTHHAPSFEGLATAMQHNIQKMMLSSGYYTDLEDFIIDRQPALWLHGHTHVTREYAVGQTRVVTNGLGRGHNHAFDPGYVVEIDAYTPPPPGF